MRGGAMEERKNRRIIDFFIILAMMAAVIVLCHPIDRNWTEEEVERYIGTEGEFSPDVDSFYYLRKAKEFSEGGMRSIKLISYRKEDAMCTSGEAIAKEANGAMPQLLPASAAFVWYGLRAVGIDVGIYTVTIRFCSFLLSLFVVPAYLFLRRRTSRTAAVLGSLLVALEVPFFRHSHVGYFDTDAMIGLLALILILSLFECFSRKTRKEQVIYGIVAFAALVLLRFTWTAFFIYGVISAGTALMGVVGVRLCGKLNEKQKKALVVPGAVWLSIVFASLILGWNAFVSLAKGFVSSPKGAGDWPSETLNISELNKVPISDADSLWYHFVGVGRDITSVTGGILALALLLMSATICVVQLVRHIRKRSEEKEEVFLLAAFLTWLAGTTMLAFFGARYMEFFTLPSAIIIGLKFDCIRCFCKGRTINGRRVLYVFAGLIIFGGLVLRFPVAAVIASGVVFAAGWFLAKQKSASVLAAVLSAAILLPVGISCAVVCAQEEPYVERPMENAMIWVRENTAPDAVLADFWNLGYIYQYYGERRTIADGGTYNGQFFYWLAEMLTAEDPRLSAGIAGMLQNCGIDGSEYATELTGNAADTRKLLKTVLPLSRSEAETELRERHAFSEEQITRLLDYTHPTNRKDIYFAVSHNTFDIISSLMVYRDWELGKKETTEGTYAGINAVSRPKEGETVISKTVLTSDKSLAAAVAIEASGEELSGYLVLPSGARMDCGRLIYIRNGETVYDRITEPSEGTARAEDEALLLFEESGQVSVVMLEKRVADSTFVNLFLGNGQNQNVFEKVYDSDEGNGIQKRLSDNSSIVIWKVVAE